MRRAGLVATASTIVFVDADGDAVADMRIVVSGTQGLTEAEFIL